MTGPRISDSHGVALPHEGAAATGATSAMSRPARYDRRKPSPPTISVIVPTFNEAGNIATLVERVRAAMSDFDYELIIVDDDSPDQTWKLAEELEADDRRLRVLRRVGRRGLSSAVLDGMAVADGQVFAVLDADLQHDEAILPDIVSAVLDGEADICLGSRGVDEGSYGEFGPLRRFASWTGAQVARRFLGVSVADPMSGFFAVSRDRYELVVQSVNPRGFKILLELLALGPRPRVAEVGYRFRQRTEGETKLSGSVVASFLVAVFGLTFGRTIPPRFRRYTLTALTMLSLRVTVLAILSLFRVGPVAQLLAIEATIIGEFVLHHRKTFVGTEDRRPTTIGPILSFHAIAGYSLLAQTGAASIILEQARRDITMSGLAPSFGLATLTVVAIVVSGYLLNGAMTWPQTTAPQTLRPGAR